MRLLLALVRSHPGPSAVLFVALVFAALAEGLSLSAVLPLAALAADPGGGVATEPGSRVEAVVLGLVRALGAEPSLGVLLGLVAVGFALKGALVLLARRQVGYVIVRAITDLRLRLIRALLGARLGYLVQRRTGGFANALGTEAQRATKAYLEATTVVLLGMQLVVYVGLAFATSWPVTLGAIVAGSALAWGLGRLVRVARRAGQHQTALLRGLLERLADVLHGLKPIKAMAREPAVERLLREDTWALDGALRRQVLASEALRALQEPLVVVAVAAGILMLHGVLSIPGPQVVLLGVLAARTLDALNKAQRRYQKAAIDESAYWSLRHGVEEAEAAAEEADGGAVPHFERAVELRGVTLARAGRPVLRGLDLTLPFGQVTALTGPSGCGKTTVADLVAGLVAPDAGEVRVDGRPLAALDRRAWRRLLGYVPQDVFLLHDSVARNVTLGEPDMPPAEVERALREAHAWDFVRALPHGMDSVVGERGAALSGGQRQRIAIARALLHRPRLLILDEATAALDPESEAAVWQALEALRGRTAVLAITHQSALLALADRVVRIAEGRAVEAPAAPRAAVSGGS